MFSLSLKVDPTNTIENLPTLGDRLKLPEGWRFRSRKLDQEMVLTSLADSDPPNTIVLDEFMGNYQYNAEASQPATPAEPKVLRDGDGAKFVRVDGLHKVRYIELFLALPEMKAGRPVAAVYNTAFMSTGVPASGDTAPQAWVEGLDFARIANEYGVKSAALNGPKLWMMDWCEVDRGVERVFNGVKVPWVAKVASLGHAETPAYKPFTIDRNSRVGWNKGTTALLLDDAEGNTWIMKGFEQGLSPKYTFDQFVAAGQSQFKQLPPGWKFRVKTLEKDLIETPEGGVATIMRDEFSNVYDKTGPGMSNYQP